jgi:predicted RNA-binding protein Jag
MCIFKKTYYYNPKLQKENLEYMVNIYSYNGKKSKRVRMYADKDYKKVLEMARNFCNPLTNCQK